ncbi:avidin-related protein 2-like isoform X2 [Cyanistes caeruleus]|uniref:avidin-related protein 2-like isoform X2 n=1 Tax=Cyanistes caeruleus TaxID=156563 RepID=UPI000CDADCAB|nr:avidin-related protein 2-like isoform X2 [Cyanistes caeruleus]
MGGGAFILVLAVALAESVAPAERKCQLSGLWRNDQDSLMEISVLRDNGDFQGQYLTRVTLSEGCALISPLRGAQQQLGEEGWPTFGFTVSWDKFSRIQLGDALVQLSSNTYAARAKGQCWPGTGESLLTQHLWGKYGVSRPC